MCATGVSSQCRTASRPAGVTEYRVRCGPRPDSTAPGTSSPASSSRPIARYMTGLGICQIRPSSPWGAVSWAMANPCVGRSLTTASTVHSGSDNVGHALMRPSLEELAPGSRAVGRPSGAQAPAAPEGYPVTGEL